MSGEKKLYHNETFFVVRILIILFLIINLFSQCGYRWAVKTMSDTLTVNQKGQKVFSNVDIVNSELTYRPTTIDSLIKLPHPVINQYRTLEETKIYTIEGKITFWTIEPDKDIHIAIRSGKARMICEIPNASKAKNSVVLDQIKKARAEFLKYKRSWHRMLPGIYQITGVLFYDKPHIEIGANKNHVELHPVLNFKKR